MTKEIWKDVVGYEGYYEISSFGNIRSITRPVLNQYGSFIKKGKPHYTRTDKKGYVDTRLSMNRTRKSIRIHRLVAEAFIPNPEGKPCVNHIDCNPSNNNVDNLEWCTHKENMEHAAKNNRLFCPNKGKFGSKNHGSKAVVQLTANLEFVNEFGGVREAARQNGVAMGGISNVCLGKDSFCGGYRFMFKRDYDAFLKTGNLPSEKFKERGYRSASKYRGVFWFDKKGSNQKWISTFSYKKKRAISYHYTEIDAAVRYDENRLKHNLPPLNFTYDQMQLKNILKSKQ